MGGPSRIAFRRSIPFSSSMAMYGEPSLWLPRSKTSTTFGWVIRATACASRSKRSFCSGSSAIWATITLRATSRSSIGSRAR